MRALLQNMIPRDMYDRKPFTKKSSCYVLIFIFCSQDFLNLKTKKLSQLIKDLKIIILAYSKVTQWPIKNIKVKCSKFGQKVFDIRSRCPS